MIDAKVEDTPSALSSNGGRAFVGSIVSGMGFTFDDENPAATPIRRMHEILGKHPECKPFVKVYVGGQQANNQPEFRPERYVINFGAMTSDEASAIPHLWSIVEAKVKPERASLKRDRYREIWWQFAEICPGLYRAIEGNSRVLVANCAAAKYLTFSFLPPGCVYSCTLYVFADPSYAHFSVIQSRIHEIWARMFGSSMKDDLRYTGSTCYENYPFCDFNQALEHVGRTYNDERASVMATMQIGLTKLSNRLNSPDDQSPEILRLREIHAAMDKSVLDAYGWSDIVPAYEFSGDYENEDGSAGAVRLNFTEEIRDEILRRLLALHAERLKAEETAVPIASATAPQAKKPKKSKDSAGPDLFNL